MPFDKPTRNLLAITVAACRDRLAGDVADHLKRYSKSRRKAPIYWPLSIPSGSYTLRLYYHRLDDQILYTAVNRYVAPKIAQVEARIARMEAELSQ